MTSCIKCDPDHVAADPPDPTKDLDLDPDASSCARGPSIPSRLDGYETHPTLPPETASCLSARLIPSEAASAPDDDNTDEGAPRGGTPRERSADDDVDGSGRVAV